MMFDKLKRGGQLSASELKKLASMTQRASPAASTGMGKIVTDGGTGEIPQESEIFLARIDSVDGAGSETVYGFTEVNVVGGAGETEVPPTTGQIEERISGRVGTTETNDIPPVPARNIARSAVVGTLHTPGEIVLIRRNVSDVNEYEIVCSTSGSASVVVLIQDAVETFLNTTYCEADPGHGAQCGTRLHLAILQTWDPECDTWIDGACVWVGDIEGRFLQRNKRYRAWGVAAPAQLAAIPIEAESYCAQLGSSVSAFYMTDAGDPVRQFVIESYVDRICPTDPETPVDGVVQHAVQAELYRARAVTFDEALCQWVDEDELVFVSESHGRSLPMAYRLTGEYHTMISVGDECLALYVINCPGFTGSRTVDNHICIPHTGTECPENPLSGDSIYTICQEFWVCGSLVINDCTEYLFPCCCALDCQPGVGTFTCSPCVELSPNQRAGRIIVTVDTGGQCPCLDGDYLMTAGDNRYLATLRVCDNIFDVQLLCINGEWFAQFACDPCAWTVDPDDPNPPPPPACFLFFPAEVTDCGRDTFSGSASTPDCITCRLGTCPGFCGLELTFSAPGS